MLKHPEVADVAVIGLEDPNQATELPRAYIVHVNPDSVKSQDAKVLFADGVRKWTESRVANHKYLRGGVIVIDVIPKSGAGKILRRELREQAKKELMMQAVAAKL